MEPAKTTAKDFFMHLGAMIALYSVVASFLNLVFSIINEAFPYIQTYSYYYYGSSPQISFAVATLIVAFPIFVILSWVNHRGYEVSPEKKDLPVRKWLTYITLFVAGAVLAGDLIAVLYKFLDGQDLSAAFILKALSVLLVASLVFGFYLQDIRNRISKKGEKVWAGVAGIIILISIILGFSIIGSPRTQRLIKQDNQKIADLQNLQWQVINYWQVNGALPDSMPNIPIDPQTGSPYEYHGLSNMAFELCAEFNVEDEPINVNDYGFYVEKNSTAKMTPQNDNWRHGRGRQCFQRTIDPVMYPTQVRG